MLYFIVNPNSGGEKSFIKWKTVDRRLKKLKISYKSFVTDGPGDATRIASEICRNISGSVTIVAVGGDGTFNEVLNGIDMDADVTLGYIPTGSGNDLAAGLHFSKNPLKALDTVLKCRKIAEMDYGVISYGEGEIINRRFAVSGGIGYDAQVCYSLDDSNMRRVLGKVQLQKMAYLVIGARDIIETKPVKGYVIIDSERKVEFNRIMFAAIQNQQTEGGGFRFAPQAVNDDGRLSVCIVHTGNKLAFTRILAAALTGSHLKYPGVRTYDCKKIKIHLDRPMAVHVDGELCGRYADIELYCVERKVRIIV